MAIRCASLLLWIVCPLTVHLADVVKEKPQVLSSSGWEVHGSQEFKFFNIKHTWEEAEVDCIQHNGHLASVHDEDEDRFIKHLIKTETGEDPPTWLGVYNSPLVPTRWYWNDESDFDFQNWAHGEPAGSGNCVQTNYNGGWGNIACTYKLPFVCARPIQKGPDTEKKENINKRVIVKNQYSQADVVKEKPQVLSYSGWELHGSREFKFFNIERSWEEAERNCNQHNAHLVSVHDSGEDGSIKYMIKTATGRDVRTWLGSYNCPAAPTRWRWGDESPFDFQNWASGEPSGFGNCVQTNYNGGWDDIPCQNKRPYVCARPIQKGGSEV